MFTGTLQYVKCICMIQTICNAYWGHITDTVPKDFKVSEWKARGGAAGSCSRCQRAAMVGNGMAGNALPVNHPSFS